jgi:hypothetical protein
MVKRFVERFQLWMDDVADEFEDKCTGWLLFLAVLFVVSDGYTLFRTHHLSPDSLLGTALSVAFVVLYLRQARWTWIPLMVLAISFATYIPFIARSSPSPSTSRRRFSLWRFGLLWLARASRSASPCESDLHIHANHLTSRRSERRPALSPRAE